MKFGYARVSTNEQNLSLQLDALTAVGCDEVVSEKISTRIAKRPAWEELLLRSRKGDGIVVYKLDRIARSTHELLKIVDGFRAKGIDLRSLSEPWADTTSSVGKLMMTVMAGIAEFERDLISQRASDGRAAARRRGVQFGRPAKLNTCQIKLIKSAREDGASVSELATAFSVSKDTIYRNLILADN